MDAKQFAKELEKIADESAAKLTNLMDRARATDPNADGWQGDNPLSYADDPNWQRHADRLAEQTGWIYDRANGRHVEDRGNMTRKLRRALGYNIT